MGNNFSRSHGRPGAPPLTSTTERFFGLSNFTNTCYANSVLQVLYWSLPFRHALLTYRHPPNKPPTLLSCIADLFSEIAHHPSQTGVIAPKAFLTKVRQENIMFSNTDHQDAHEFLNWLLNDLCDEVDRLEKERKEVVAASRGGGGDNNEDVAVAPERDGDGEGTTGRGQTKVKGGKGEGEAGELADYPIPPPIASLRSLFEGDIVTETRCLRCETITLREEKCLDLSLEITAPRCSISACLRQFSDVELLSRNDKYFCDQCCSLQEAQKRMVVRKAPTVLVLHLKRFEYVESLQRLKKLSHRVSFPPTLRLASALPGPDGADAHYRIKGVVVHVGSGPYHGHYIALTRTAVGEWARFDDEIITFLGGAPEEKSDVFYGGRVDQDAFLLVYERE